MTDIMLPAICALVLWWVSTGAIMYVIGFSPRTYPLSLSVAAVMAAVALWVLSATDAATAFDAYAAFTATLVVWGLVEMTFLMGYITGPRKSDCPAGATGFRRAVYATETIIFHELALVAAGAAVAFATWGGANWVGLGTFLLLWVMRLSSKLNLFLGVPTLNDDLLPRQLRHLRTYFRKRPMNALFPVSLIVSGVGTVVLLARANADGASAFETCGYVLLAALLALALLEHIFMVLPMSVAALWGKRTRPALAIVASSISAKTETPAPSSQRTMPRLVTTEETEPHERLPRRARG